MKRITLFMFLALLAISSWGQVKEDDYLIENVEGGYLGGGNDWGTHATLLGKPQWFTTTLENGKYTLDSHQSNGEELHYLAGDLYTDGAAYEWILTEVSKGVYTIANAEGKLITADGMNNVVSLVDQAEGSIPNSAKWKFVSMNDVLKSMDNANSISPVDVTSLIKDPELKRNGNTMDIAWTITGYDGVGKAKNFAEGQGGNVANCAESWHSSNGFKAVQIISLPKAGVYSLTAQGFYQQDDSLIEDISYLFAGDQKYILPAKTGEENNMVEAYAAFLAKKYPVHPITITTTSDNEEIAIGIAGNANHMWSIFGELELKYYGSKKINYFSPVARDGETVQYLYNIEAKGFVLGANDWGTRASVNPETGYKFKVKANGDGTYTLNDYCLGNDKKTWMWSAIFADSGIGIWVDNVNGANVNKWVVTPVAGEENVYEITNPSADQGKLGVKTDLSDTRLYINNEEGYSTRWAFMSEEQYEQYMSDFAIDIEETKQKILDAKNTISLAAWKDIIDGTNIYDASGYNAYVQQYNDYTSQLVAGTLKEEVINPSTPTDWHASTAYNFLLTPWTIGGEVCNNFDKALYINTWSKEGETDGSNFLVPFFEYWTNDDSSLGTNSIATKVSNLEPNSTYEVKLLARVRIKNNVTGSPYGISMAVGDGESVNLCGGVQIGNTQMYLAEFTAQGSVDKDGNLYVNIDIANDNNVNWLAFKNVKYTKVADAPALVSSITLSHNTLEINEGETAQLTATVAPSNAANKNVSWTSDNTAVATVDANGLVTAVSEGTATITCSAEDGSGVSATCSVTVAPSADIVSGECGDSVIWKLNLTTGVMKIEGAGKMKDFTSSLSSSPWRDYSQIITEVIISEGVTYIGNNAFRRLDSLLSVSIPESIVQIGTWAFDECRAVTTVNISDLAAWCNIEFRNSSSNPLRYAQKLLVNGVEVKDLVIPNSVTSIGSFAFYGYSGLASVTIPNSVSEIGQKAFNNNIELLRIEGTGALTGSSWGLFKVYVKKVEVAEGITQIGKEVFSHYNMTEVKLPKSLTSIGESAFAFCRNLSSVNIPEGVTSMGESAFRGCSNLTSINIPESVTSIGESAFSGCSNLASIKIPEGVTSIGEYAFSGCSNLTSINIPNSVKSIGDYAFSGCKELPIIDGYRYADTYLVELIDKKQTGAEIKEGTRFIGSEAFENSSLSSVTIPKTIVGIGHNAFYGCSNLVTVNIHDLESWCKIEFSNGFGWGGQPTPHHLFINGVEVKDLVIPSSITQIGKAAFYACEGITSVTIPNSVTSIGEGAFDRCTGLTSIVIPNSVTTLGTTVFWGCTGLTSATIGSSVDSIGVSVFTGCTNLKSVTCLATDVPTIGDWGYICPGDNAVLYVPESALEAYKTTKGWNDFAEIKPIDPTAIDSIHGSSDVIPVEYISINGYRNTKAQKGINIIKMSDGSVRKVITK